MRYRLRRSATQRLAGLGQIPGLDLGVTVKLEDTSVNANASQPARMTFGAAQSFADFVAMASSATNVISRGGGGGGASVPSSGLLELDAVIESAQGSATVPEVTTPPAGDTSIDGSIRVGDDNETDDVGRNGYDDEIWKIKPPPKPAFSFPFDLKWWQAALITGGLVAGGVVLFRFGR